MNPAKRELHIPPLPQAAKAVLEHFAQKWNKVLRNNMRENKEIGHGFDFIETCSKAKTHRRSGVRREGF